MFCTLLKAEGETDLPDHFARQSRQKSLRLARTTKRTKYVHVTLEVSFEQDAIGLYSNHPETSVKYFVTNL